MGSSECKEYEHVELPPIVDHIDKSDVPKYRNVSRYVTVVREPTSFPNGGIRQLCVLFHIGYLSEWDWYEPYLQNIPKPYDLYITVTVPPHRDDVSTVAERAERINDSFAVIPIPNRGMDGGGWVKALKFIFDHDIRYRYVLKLHTKRAIPENANWRRSLIDALLGNGDRFQRCIDTMEEDPCVGMLGSEDFVWAERRRRDVDDFAAQLNIPPMSYSVFVAGTMFVARFEPLVRPFRGVDLDALFSTFACGKTKEDSHGHWLERLYGNIIRQSGLRVCGLKTKVPSCFEGIPPPFLDPKTLS
jgi:lipopolysaccharide biosynthesis protein